MSHPARRPEAADYTHMAAPLSAELRSRWPLDDGELVGWVAGAIALGAATERAAAAAPRFTTWADLLQAVRAYRAAAGGGAPNVRSRPPGDHAGSSSVRSEPAIEIDPRDDPR